MSRSDPDITSISAMRSGLFIWSRADLSAAMAVSPASLVNACWASSMISAIGLCAAACSARNASGKVAPSSFPILEVSILIAPAMVTLSSPAFLAVFATTPR